MESNSSSLPLITTFEIETDLKAVLKSIDPPSLASEAPATLAATPYVEKLSVSNSAFPSSAASATTSVSPPCM